MPYLDAISFFVAVLLIVPAVIVCFSPWNLRYCDGLRFVVGWMLFTVVVLVMNQVGREMLDPNRWQRERLFYGVEGSYLIGAETPVQNLLFGWFLFPLRVLPQVQFYTPAIITGIIALMITLLSVHFVGKLIVGKQWKMFWSFSVIGTFLMLYVTTFATIGLLRQICWIFTSFRFTT
ncbi:MAG: hypothetical protein LBQ50_08635 [Planctomycetaceae bacterium]|jgi:hypothetical protein|nr:hypothetical protein [Planctomycetaceae bacterium]